MPQPSSEPDPRATYRRYHCDLPADPVSIVIFGASGDLTHRKLLPALYSLAADECLAPRFAIVGFARTALDDDGFRAAALKGLRELSDVGPVDDRKWREFAAGLRYITADSGDPTAYLKLSSLLARLDQERGLGGNRLFYLATPPEAFPVIVEQLGRAGLAQPRSDSYARIVLEKPIGRDLASARELNHRVHAVFDESQVYRIDHYLGKETVQNLLVFRFGNGIFEPLWNRNYVNHIQITAAESLGVERRAAYYEGAGALRDMIQSHVLQLLALVAMEPPAQFEATAVRNEKIKVLQSIRPFARELVEKLVVRGQYGAGATNGQSMPGYQQEPGVRADSPTETYVAVKLYVDNWRWAGVPFYLRTGKRLRRHLTEIAIEFRRAPHLVFRGRNVEPNRLVLNIQPDEGISLSFGAKMPGPQLDISSVPMTFSYREAFGEPSRSAYSMLLNDCMRGDATLFARADTIEVAWRLLDPILNSWSGTKPGNFPNYAAGSAGPREAEELIERDGRRWREL